MELPYALKSAIEELAEAQPRAQLADAARSTSQRYRDNTGGGERLLSTDIEAAAYAAARMPATYGAVSAALSGALEILGDTGPVSLVDVGAGTGAGTWAAASTLELKDVICLERESAMRNVGGALMKASDDEALSGAKWQEFDLTSEKPLPSADIVLVSYVLNELRPAHRMRAAERLFAAADKMLLIVEPGTPHAWRQLMELRRFLVEKGAFVAAPCTHMDKCPVPEEDWCHFTCRIARSKLHKALKTGDAPYEDEKFTYLALTKEPAAPAKGRVIRHPQIEPGRITLRMCMPGGIEDVSVRKKDALFKWARKCACGDALPAGGEERA